MIASIGRFVRAADLHPPKMLRDARMADLVELRRGIGTVGGRQLWAVLVGHLSRPGVVPPQVRMTA